MMEIASEKVNRVQFAVEGQSLEYFLLGANEPKEAIKRYTDLTGKTGASAGVELRALAFDVLCHQLR